MHCCVSVSSHLSQQDLTQQELGGTHDVAHGVTRVFREVNSTAPEPCVCAVLEPLRTCAQK